MKIKELKFLGSGSGSDVYMLDDNKVVVVGKRGDCFSNYQQLMKKSNDIEGKITTVKYPRIHKVVVPCQDFPFGAMVEDYISGKELREKCSQLKTSEKMQIGKEIGLFLNQLHSTSICGDKNEEIDINLKKFDKSVMLLNDYLPKENLDKLQAVKKEYHKLMSSKDFCITHGDLNAGNIMISDDNKLSGIIDFGNMEYYIPEVEFIHMYFFDKVIFEAMINNYNQAIREQDMILLELVTNIRHFKNIVNFEEKRNSCLKNIKSLTIQYTCQINKDKTLQ